jgi:quercetin 2,3-dioxygenase
VEGFQIWINLPKDKKMMRPKYQDYPPEKVPRLLLARSEEGERGEASEVWVNVIAGEAYGVKSIITTEVRRGF